MSRHPLISGLAGGSVLLWAVAIGGANAAPRSTPKKKVVAVTAPQPAAREAAASPATARSRKPDTDPIDLFFDLESSFLQGVPQFNTGTLNHDRLVTVEGKHYGVALGTGKVISRLLRDKRVRVTIVSKLPEERTRQILDGIYLDADRKRSLGSAVSAIVPREAPEKLLERKCPKPERCVLVSDNAFPAVAAGHVVRSGPTYFHFDSFEQARAGEEETKKHPTKYEAAKPFFPPDETAWKQHQQRMEGVFFPIDRALRESAEGEKDFAEVLKAQDSSTLAQNIRSAEKELRRVLKWTVEGGRATGCVSTDPENAADSRPVDPDICVTELPTRLAWTGAKRDQCSRVAEDGGAVVTEQPVDACIESLKVYYLWASKDLSVCGVFNEHKVLVKTAPNGRCTTDVVCDPQAGVLSGFNRDLANGLVFKDLKDLAEVESFGCNQPSIPVTADDSPRKRYFTELLARGARAPLEDFLKLWYPERGDGGDKDAAFFACQVEPWGQIAPKADGFLSSECTPDTVYSWGPMEKLQTIQRRAPDRGSWGGSSINKYTLYATFSASSTYPYGSVPIRIKLKPGTRARYKRPGGLGEIGYYSTGSFRDGYQYQDVTLNDGAVIENWSFATPEHYDEIVRDALRTMSGKRGYVYCCGPPKGSGTARLDTYRDYVNRDRFDGHPTGPEHLKAALLEMVRMILNGQGRIYYADGVCRNRTHAFKTTRPSYMNP